MDYEDKIIAYLHAKGVATEKAMPIFLDDKSYYVNSIREFLKENEIEQLSKCVKEQNYESALDHAYNLKALTGTFGMSKAYQVSQELCMNLHERKYDIVIQQIESINYSYEKLNELFGGIFNAKRD